MALRGPQMTPKTARWTPTPRPAHGSQSLGKIRPLSPMRGQMTEAKWGHAGRGNRAVRSCAIWTTASSPVPDGSRAGTSHTRPTRVPHTTNLMSKQRGRGFPPTPSSRTAGTTDTRVATEPPAADRAGQGVTGRCWASRAGTDRDAREEPTASAGSVPRFQDPGLKCLSLRRVHICGWKHIIKMVRWFTFKGRR